ncbi:transcriptional regulator BetI [Novosphingobium sp. AAP1]|uniref:transcriptional regulator BetI n=1 Tax=Novosphingobium sp. AAP1 TaxID=1523413 RepID=UPI0009E9E223|nr:transcriptional regulator BetI [Novosphingobium sp. AAP1]
MQGADPRPGRVPRAATPARAAATDRALPRRAEPDARRHSLIEAAMRVLARAGANGASVRAIAQEAGVSPGLVGHYFSGIDALIAETYTHVDAMVTQALNAAVAAAPSDPRAQLEAFVTASFTAPIAQPALLATWIAFWSLVTSQPQIARQHDEQYAGYRARLEQLLREAGVAEGDLRHAAIAVTALVDGLWLELCLSPQCFSSEEAGAIARRFLGTVCGDMVGE